MYLWIKAFHIIFVVTWFAGLFYIYRLFIYHSRYRDKKDIIYVYQLMERRLLTIIMYPSMFLTICFGVLMLMMNTTILYQGWFHSKVAAVLFLIIYQIFASVVHKRFLGGDFFIKEGTLRILNEVPALFLIVIVILAVVKP